MRTRVTRKPWFGPKLHRGWGWRAASWEGRLTSAVFVVLVVAAALIWHGSARAVALIALLAMYFAVLLLTGDPPGGPR
jgi:hypothetical protein